jgi:hypothetical protein
MFDRISLPFLTTDAEVSSHDVSIPRIYTSFCMTIIITNTHLLNTYSKSSGLIDASRPKASYIILGARNINFLKYTALSDIIMSVNLSNRMVYL